MKSARRRKKLYTRTKCLVTVSVMGLAFGLFALFSLSRFGYYPVPYFEKIVDPHMYYIREFVHSLPPDIQEEMTEKAASLGLNVYEYNLQMCGYTSRTYLDWWF